MSCPLFGYSTIQKAEHSPITGTVVLILNNKNGMTVVAFSNVGFSCNPFAIYDPKTIKYKHTL